MSGHDVTAAADDALHGVRPGDHLLQLYEQDEFLVRRVTTFLAEGIDQGQAAIMVGTPAHRDDVVRDLHAGGVEVDRLRERGLFVGRDARATLESVMAGPMPDATRFRDEVRTSIDRASASARGVRIYGEMVDLLSRDGNPAAAEGLEDLWNEFGQERPFTLLCGYSVARFAGEVGSARYQRACRQHTGVLAAESGRLAEPLAQGLRILVVDDNVDSAESMGLYLDLLGHRTRTAHDGLEALAAADSFLPDVLLLDVGLPRMSGHDVARSVRARPWGSRVLLIAMSGWGQPADRRRSREAGFDHHLTKPVDLVGLTRLLAATPAGQRRSTGS
jgi:CheY-like chemotaxis protein